MSGVMTVARRSPQAGAASLIVVMILLFVVSMVAAYSSRTLIFEQKISANQQRSTRALESADAGLQWALSMLNAGRTTAACSLSADPADTSFRDRYLVIDDATGHIRPRKRSTGEDLYPTCVYNGSAWTCDCPSDAAPAVAGPGGDGIFPAFRVRFRRVCTKPSAPDTACADPLRASVVHIDVNGCTSPSEDCLKFVNGKPADGESRATLHVIATLKSALPTAPAAALTARWGVDVGASSLGVFNNEPGSSGVTIHRGGGVNAVFDASSARLFGPTGTPGANTISAPDNALHDLTPGRLFESTFGLREAAYREQPAAVIVDCSATCNTATVRARALMNPGRVLWLTGNGGLALDGSDDIGTPTVPVVLVVDGNVTFGGSGKVHGLVYVRTQGPGHIWTAAGGATVIRGAVVTDGKLTGTPTADIVRDSDILRRLRTTTGSFVPLPGSWRDFE
jgi:Tfp pilus assembly protein PilX